MLFNLPINFCFLISVFRPIIYNVAIAILGLEADIYFLFSVCSLFLSVFSVLTSCGLLKYFLEINFDLSAVFFVCFWWYWGLNSGPHAC
jgi:hypothetical protein